ncbi:T9SS type A sorting domain-containing protein [Flavobacteriales bacterium]|nr:T9SS type A sorting domain-containing protein [Flavobacteriales bacterium]
MSKLAAYIIWIEMKVIVSLIIAAVSVGAFAQEDTVRVMQYNLLNYGNYTSYCNTNNNNVDDKDGYLTTILDYVQPDIFTVNELGVDFVGLENQYAQRILDNTLNINGVTKYQKAEHTGGSYLVNMLYYNSDKLVLHSQDFISNDANNEGLVREIDFYNLYHNDPNLASHNDTVFLTVVVAHLKAGSGQDDQDERAAASLAVMGYLDANDGAKGNRILCGDFNVKGDTELAYSHLFNYSNTNVRFKDPLNEPGYWGGAWEYKHLHTQSTRDNVSTGDCPSGGGLDDRFDFVLTSEPIIWGDNGISYLPNTYTAVGNDGTSYNNDLNTITNSSVPPAVADALFNLSDHLPVVMDMRISKDLVSGISQPNVEQLNIEFTNPVENELTVRLPNNARLQQLQLFDLQGKLVYQNNTPHQTHFVISTEQLKTGVYFLSVQTQDGNHQSYKVVKF